MFLLKNPSGVAQPDTQGNAKQLAPLDDAGKTDIHRQRHAAVARTHEPALDRIGIETDLADHMPGEEAVRIEGFVEQLGADRGMALPIAGNANALKVRGLSNILSVKTRS